MTPSEVPLPTPDAARALQRRHRRVQSQIYATALVRRYVKLATALWVVTSATALLHDDVLPLLAIHGAGVVFAFLVMRALRAEETERSETRLAFLFMSMGTVLNALLTLAALLTGGLSSLYLPLQVIPATGIAVVSIPWRKLALRGVPTIFAPWLLMMVVLSIVPELRAQLSDPVLLRRAGMILFVELMAVVVFVFIGDNHFRLRGQLYASRSLGRYRLKERVGGGGMGEVWAAYDTAMKRDVALKVLKTAGERAPQARFEREVEALASLTHPNTVRVFDYATTEDGLRYYAMELLSGCTLSELVRREGPLPWRRAIHMLAAAASALGEAHVHGIVHRDIKPDNIFVAEAGGERDFVKVLDFGVAQMRDPQRAALTTTGLALGTPAYMSPEVILGRPAKPPADVYGLGATLYFVLTGTPPHERERRDAVLQAHLDSEVEPPNAGRPEARIPAPVEALCLRCLAKDASKRPADGAELARALQALLDPSPPEAPPPTSLASHAPLTRGGRS